MAVSLYLLVLFIAGMMLPFQAGMNAELAKYTSNAQALLLSFLIGVPFLSLMLIPSGLPTMPQMKAAPWWAWVGGIIGIFYVFTITYTAKYTGALALVGAVTAGQVIGSTVADHYGLAGFPRQAISWQRIAGGLFVVTGVWLSVRGGT